MCLAAISQRGFITMDRWTGKVALVTGASSGIGAQITKALAKNGLKVIAVARRMDRLETLAAGIKSDLKTEIYPMQCDIRKEKDILKVFNWAHTKFGGVDVMINGAGAIYPEPIIEGSTENYRKIMDVNVIAMAICSRELVQSVKKRKAYGHIININSITGHSAQSVKLPISLYCASKYAVTGMNHSLRNELKAASLDVRVTSISPGLVETEMMDAVGFTDNLMKKIIMLQDTDIADAAIYALGAPQNAQIWEIIIMPYQVPAGPDPLMY